MYVSTYIVTLSLEKSLPGMSSWRIAVNPALWERTRFPLSIHESMPCREASCSVFTTSTHTSCAPQHVVPRARGELLALPPWNKRGAGEQEGIVCWRCRSSHGQSSGTLTRKYHHMCLFKPHTYFSDFKEYKDSYFFKQQYFSYCYFYFHLWTIRNAGVSC